MKFPNYCRAALIVIAIGAMGCVKRDVKPSAIDYDVQIPFKPIDSCDKIFLISELQAYGNVYSVRLDPYRPEFISFIKCADGNRLNPSSLSSGDILIGQCASGFAKKDSFSIIYTGSDHMLLNSNYINMIDNMIPILLYRVPQKLWGTKLFEIINHTTNQMVQQIYCKDSAVIEVVYRDSRWPSRSKLLVDEAAEVYGIMMQNHRLSYYTFRFNGAWKDSRVYPD